MPVRQHQAGVAQQAVPVLQQPMPDEASSFKTQALGGKAGGFGLSHVKPGVDRRKLFLHLAAGWRIWPLKEGEGEPE